MVIKKVVEYLKISDTKLISSISGERSIRIKWFEINIQLQFKKIKFFKFFLDLLEYISENFNRINYATLCLTKNKYTLNKFVEISTKKLFGFYYSNKKPIIFTILILKFKIRRN